MFYFANDGVSRIVVPIKLESIVLKDHEAFKNYHQNAGYHTFVLVLKSRRDSFLTFLYLNSQ